MYVNFFNIISETKLKYNAIIITDWTNKASDILRIIWLFILYLFIYLFLFRPDNYIFIWV
jgi:hypothetical protein